MSHHRIILHFARGVESDAAYTALKTLLAGAGWDWHVLGITADLVEVGTKPPTPPPAPPGPKPPRVTPEWAR